MAHALHKQVVDMFDELGVLDIATEVHLVEHRRVEHGQQAQSAELRVELAKNAFLPALVEDLDPGVKDEADIAAKKVLEMGLELRVLVYAPHHARAPVTQHAKIGLDRGVQPCQRRLGTVETLHHLGMERQQVVFEHAEEEVFLITEVVIDGGLGQAAFLGEVANGEAVIAALDKQELSGIENCQLLGRNSWLCAGSAGASASPKQEIPRASPPDLLLSPRSGIILTDILRHHSAPSTAERPFGQPV